MKYGAKKTVCAAGHTHDSGMEARRCDELTAKEQAGEITHLVQQPEYPAVIEGRKVFLYRGDFSYRMAGSGLPISEDVKGFITRDFSIKRKVIEALYGIVITPWPPRVRKKRKSAKRKQAA